MLVGRQRAQEHERRRRLGRALRAHQQHGLTAGVQLLEQESRARRVHGGDEEVGEVQPVRRTGEGGRRVRPGGGPPALPGQRLRVHVVFVDRLNLVAAAAARGREGGEELVGVPLPQPAVEVHTVLLLQQRAHGPAEAVEEDALHRRCKAPAGQQPAGQHKGPRRAAAVVALALGAAAAFVARAARPARATARVLLLLRVELGQVDAALLRVGEPREEVAERDDEADARRGEDGARVAGEEVEAVAHVRRRVLA